MRRPPIGGDTVPRRQGGGDRQRPTSQLKVKDAAIVSVVGSFLSSSSAVACWDTDGEMTLRFGINVSSEEFCLSPCAGCVLLNHIQEMCWAALQQNTLLGASYQPSE